jgi:hypothetical protein
MIRNTTVVCLLIAAGFGLTAAIVLESRKRVSEHRLDEEALARMDDEGGSNNPATSPPGAAG